MTDDELFTITRRMAKRRSAGVSVPADEIWSGIQARRRPGAPTARPAPGRRTTAIAASLLLMCAAVAGALGVVRLRAWIETRAAAAMAGDGVARSRVATDALARAAADGWHDERGGRSHPLQVVLPPGLAMGEALNGRAPVPIRPLGAIVATTREPLKDVTGIRVLSTGRVLVSDAWTKRVLLFDSTLSTYVTVADTTGGTRKAYGNRRGGLLAFYGDSSLFIDEASTSMLVIDPRGKIVRVIAVPAPDVTLADLVARLEKTVFDGAGHVLFTVSQQHQPNLIPDGTVQKGWMDSSAVERVDITSRKVDTVARLKVSQQVVESVNGCPVSATCYSTAYSSAISIVHAPLSPTDDWALLPDGTIALVRVGDYHVDWLGKGGTRTASPRIEHAWEHIADSMKVAMTDSLKRMDSVSAAMRLAARARRDSIDRGNGGTAGGFAAGAAGGGGGRSGAAGSGGGLGGMRFPLQQVEDPNDVPDYWPPFDASSGRVAVQADAEGNLWIQELQRVPLAGGPVFDIVNRAGTLIDRVQIPGETVIVGFGPRVVYLSAREGAGYQLARAKIH